MIKLNYAWKERNDSSVKSRVFLITLKVQDVVVNVWRRHELVFNNTARHAKLQELVIVTRPMTCLQFQHCRNLFGDCEADGVKLI